MTKTKLLASILLCAFFILLLPTSVLAAMDLPVSWGKSDDQDRGAFNAVVPLSDGGVIVVGQARFGDQRDMEAIATRYSSSGEIVWKNTYGGNVEDYFTSAVMVGGTLWAVGYSKGPSVGLDNNWGHVNTNNNAYFDAILVGINPDTGKVVYAQNYGCTGNFDSRFTGIASNGTDQLYIVGYSRGGSNNIAGLPGSATEWGHKGSTDAIALCVDLVGAPNICEVQWAQNYGGGSYEQFTGITLAGDTLYAVGYAEGASTNLATNNWGAPAGKEDGILVAIDPISGVDSYAKNYGGVENDRFHAIAADSGVLYIAGESDGTSTNPAWNHSAQGDAIALAIDTSDLAAVKWSKNYGGTDVDTFQSAIIANGALYVAGYSMGLNAPWGLIDILDGIIAKLSLSDGELLSAQNYGGAHSDFFYAITITADGAVYAVGSSHDASTNLVSLGAPAEWGHGHAGATTNAVIVRFAYPAPTPTPTPTPSGLTGIACATAANNDGKIIGFDYLDRYDYKPATDTNWITLAAGTTELTGLAPGDYHVRFSAVQQSLAGPHITISVAAYTSSDTTAPELSEGTAIRVSDIQALVNFNSNEAGTYAYIVQEANQPAPALADVQNSTNTGTMKSGANTFVPAALTDDKAKIVYMTGRDAAGNWSGLMAIIIPPDHTVLEKPDTLSDGQDAVFTIKGEYVDLNGASITHENGTVYTFDLSKGSGQTMLSHNSVTAGDVVPSSVKITLYAAWLDTLPAGTYTLKVDFNDGTVQSSGSADFVLTRAADTTPATATGSPQTGDASNRPLWVALGTTALAVLVVLALKRKQQKAK